MGSAESDADAALRTINAILENQHAIPANKINPEQAIAKLKMLLRNPVEGRDSVHVVQRRHGPVIDDQNVNATQSYQGTKAVRGQYN